MVNRMMMINLETYKTIILKNMMMIILKNKEYSHFSILFNISWLICQELFTKKDRKSQIKNWPLADLAPDNPLLAMEGKNLLKNEKPMDYSQLTDRF